MSSVCARNSAICSLRDRQPQLRFGLGQRDPQPPPGAELPLVAPQRGHLARGVAGDQRVFVSFVHGEDADGNAGAGRLASAATPNRLRSVSFLWRSFRQHDNRQHNDQADQAERPNGQANGADVANDRAARLVAHARAAGRGPRSSTHSTTGSASASTSSVLSGSSAGVMVLLVAEATQSVGQSRAANVASIRHRFRPAAG